MDKRKLRALFTIAGFIAVPAIAHANIQKKSVIPLDQIPIEQRAVIYEAILERLRANPNLMKNPKGAIAIDEKGTVYELETNLLYSGTGQPSTVTN